MNFGIYRTSVALSLNVEHLDAGTIKNRMSDLRWIAKKYNISQEIPSSNAKLNIPKRNLVSNTDKSRSLTEGNLSRVTDQNIKMSLILQREFGLRRCESIKIKLHQAVQGHELKLKGSWCKNGRPRTIKIEYPEQWAAIEQVKTYLGKERRSLIPNDKTYVQQKNVYEYQVKSAGIDKGHGIRHAYAQRLYQDITGFACSVKGGPTRQERTCEKKRLDKMARHFISEALGHSRVDVVAIYCGS
jgi:integrase